MIRDTKRTSRIALLIQFFLFGFMFSSLLARFPALKELFHMSAAELSFVPFFMSVGSLIIMPFCAYIIGRYGSKKTSITGYLPILFLPLILLMPNIFLLYTGCMLFGASVGISDVAINANSLVVEKAYKRPIIGLFHAFFYVGMFSGALLSILFLVNEIDIRIHLAAINGVALVTFFFIRRYFLNETPSAKVQNDFKITIPKGTLLTIALVALCGRIIEGGISDWSTVYMNEIVKISATYAPAGLAIYAVFISVGRFFGDSVRAMYGDVKVLVASCIITAIGLGMMISVSHIAVVIAALFICGLGVSCLVPIIYSIAGKRKDVSPGVGLATVNTISGTGFLLGPSVIGFIAEKSSLRVSFLYVLVLALIMTWLARTYQQKSAQ